MFTVNLAKFKKALALTAFIVKKPARPCIEGVYLHSFFEGLRVVSTDNVRISIVTIPTEMGLDFNAIVPLEAVNQLLKLKLPKHPTTMKVSLCCDNSMLFSSSPGEVTCDALNAQYPNYQAVIPREERFAGNSVPVNLNPIYLGEIYKAVSPYSRTISVRYPDSANTPIRIDTGIAGFQHYIMPAPRDNFIF